MEITEFMKFRILLPDEIFLNSVDITSLQVSQDTGSFGFLPQRLDCVAALNAGLLTYTSPDGTEHFVAIDHGILTKAGLSVTAAVRNAISGTDLGELHLKVNEQFRVLDQEEQQVRQVIAQLETGFIRNFEQLRRS